MAVRLLLLLALFAHDARAQGPGVDTSTLLREANAAATAGDWPKLAAYVPSLFARSLDRAELAEAHRLAGLAQFFTGTREVAEGHFLEYLRIDLDGRLDAALYPPDVVGFFDDVRARHAAELRARRPKQKRYWALNLIPPFGQFQNGERTKGWILGGTLVALTATNLTTYGVLRSWCTTATNEMTGQSSVTCDEQNKRASSARTLRSLNLVSGAALIVTYVWGVYDGVRGYQRRERAQSFAPFATPMNDGALVGVHAVF